MNEIIDKLFAIMQFRVFGPFDSNDSPSQILQNGAKGGTRTHDIRFRKSVLYPPELPRQS